MKERYSSIKFNAEAIKLHYRYHGKLEVTNKIPLRTGRDLALLYTPGVGAVSALIGKNKNRASDFTIKRNSVAVISDGSAVLGLGNIGPEGALPVLEGKCAIFKRFANIDAYPLAFATQDVDEIVNTVKIVAPVFGGINLEDISAPRCFEIESRLKRELDIPVMHDDQHGAAIVTLAGLINAAKVVKKNLKKLRVVVNGAGPAGTATARLLLTTGIKNVMVLDSTGIISNKRSNLVAYKKGLAKITKPWLAEGNLGEALLGADVFIGLSRPNLMTRKEVSFMGNNPIVFALANPVPEIMPEEAIIGGAKVVATGRSDFPNQVNNALVFPGIFRGALDKHVLNITDNIKIDVACALARLVKSPNRNRILPRLFNKRVVNTVAKAVR